MMLDATSSLAHSFSTGAFEVKQISMSQFI